MKIKLQKDLKKNVIVLFDLVNKKHKIIAQTKDKEHKNFT